MADDGTVTSSLKLEDTQPSAGVLSQYVKDLSVENPNAPEAFQWTDQAQMDIQFNIAARIIQPEVHEAELKITLTAKHEAGTAYIVDLTFGGLIGMRGLDDAQMHAFVFAEAPRLMFPLPAACWPTPCATPVSRRCCSNPSISARCISSRCSSMPKVWTAPTSPPPNRPATPDICGPG
jgi:preprotein translocase subunit SecB